MAYRISSRLACALVFALVSYPAPVQAQSADRAGEVAEIHQSGLQLHLGRVDWLEQGDPVIRNARLETDGVGEMALAMDDGSHLVLMSDSDIVIDRFVYDPDRTMGQAVISLGRGALRMVSGRLPSDRYQVNTPVATIGLRGTDFTAELVPGTGLVVKVDDGAVEIRPTDSDERFTISRGQVGLCNENGCRNIDTGNPPLRRARLGPPASGEPEQEAGQGQNRDRADLGAANGTVRTASLNTAGAVAAKPACAPYRIPARAYRQVGLDSAQWPGMVDGITFHHHTPDGPVTELFCPYQIKPVGNQTGFTVMGQAASGDTRTLYFVNTLAGQAFFQPGFNRRAKEDGDAEAYRSYMSRILEDQPEHRVIKSKAKLHKAASDQLVLRQIAHARVAHGEYLVSGITLFRPVSGGRTGLFSIPAVVTPRQSQTALTAKKISRPLFLQLPDAVVVEDSAD